MSDMRGRRILTTLQEDGRLIVELAEESLPPPTGHDVVVRVEAAPINPSDLGLLFGPADLDNAEYGDGRIVATMPDGARRAMAARVGQAMPVGHAHDQTAGLAHFPMQQADGILVGVIGPEAVGADQLGQPLGLVRRRHVPRAAHFRQANLHPRLRQLPRRFRPGEAAADDVEARCACKAAFRADDAAWRASAPGGIVGGDGLTLQLGVAQGAGALLTTPAATKVYRSAGASSQVIQSFDVAAGGALEWLPSDTILFGGSRHRLQTRVNLAGDAVFFGWEVVSLGRPAAGDDYALGDFGSRMTITRDGTPLLVEGQRWDNADDARWQLAGHRVFGAVYIHPGDPDLTELARSALDAGPVAASLVDDVLVIRALGDDPVRIRQTFERIWAACRPLLAGLPACAPRIWAT